MANRFLSGTLTGLRGRGGRKIAVRLRLDDGSTIAQEIDTAAFSNIPPRSIGGLVDSPLSIEFDDGGNVISICRSHERRGE